MDRFGKRLAAAVWFEQQIKSRITGNNILIIGGGRIHEDVLKLKRSHDDVVFIDDSDCVNTIISAVQQIRSNNYAVPEIVCTTNKNHLLKLGIDFSKEHFTFEMPSDNPAVESLRKSPIRK